MHGIEFFPTDAGFTISGRLATPSLCNEAEPSSRDATARALTFPSFTGQDRSCALKGRLHGSRPFTMMNTFQFIRTTRLHLALSGLHGFHGWAEHRDRGPEKNAEWKSLRKAPTHIAFHNRVELRTELNPVESVLNGGEKTSPEVILLCLIPRGRVVHLRLCFGMKANRIHPGRACASHHEAHEAHKGQRTKRFSPCFRILTLKLIDSSLRIRNHNCPGLASLFLLFVCLVCFAVNSSSAAGDQPDSPRGGNDMRDGSQWLEPRVLSPRPPRPLRDRIGPAEALSAQSIRWGLRDGELCGCFALSTVTEHPG